MELRITIGDSILIDKLERDFRMQPDKYRSTEEYIEIVLAKELGASVRAEKV